MCPFPLLCRRSLCSPLETEAGSFIIIVLPSPKYNLQKAKEFAEQAAKQLKAVLDAIAEGAADWRSGSWRDYDAIIRLATTSQTAQILAGEALVLGVATYVAIAALNAQMGYA